MDALKKLFPLSFKYTKDVPNLIIGILVQIVAIVIVGALIWLATALVGWIPVVGWLIAWVLGIISSLLGIYLLASIIIQVLVFAKVIK